MRLSMYLIVCLFTIHFYLLLAKWEPG